MTRRERRNFNYIRRLYYRNYLKKNNQKPNDFEINWKKILEFWFDIKKNKIIKK